jgi:uncharacterized protein YggE
MRSLTLASLLALTAFPVTAVPLTAASAQTVPLPAIAGTRLDVIGTGEVHRVPDIARISTGVVTMAPTATAALEQNARQMASVRAALKKAGIADRDIQTSAINLYPDYRQDERGGNPTLNGYRASNDLTVRFRDIANTGRILDALVAQGANQINGPQLGLEKPEAAMDEARVKAITSARARAELYARAIGKRVGRILSISEAGSGMPYERAMMRMDAGIAASGTSIEPGEQTIAVSVAVSFELE